MSERLKKPFDNSITRVEGCYFYDDFAYFNLEPLLGPYAVTAVVDGVTKNFEVRFCGPADQNNGGTESSLVFEIDNAGNRVSRLTSGVTEIFGFKTSRTFNIDEEIDEVTGINYTP